MSMLRLASIVCLAGLAVQSVAAAPRDSDSVAATRAAVHAQVPFCAGGLERLLPGQYNFCAAVRDFGRGNDGLARQRLTDAAAWASKPAQYVLGLIYFNGDGVPANRPLGAAWLALAGERHDPRFEPSFAKAYLELSPAERDQANTYWAELRTKYSDATAGKRAERVYNDQIRSIRIAAMFGGSVLINGTTPPGITENDTHANSNFGEVSSVMGQSGVSAETMISKSADDLFQGMDGHVSVGEAQMTLVPIGNAFVKATPKGD